MSFNYELLKIIQVYGFTFLDIQKISYVKNQAKAILNKRKIKANLIEKFLIPQIYLEKENYWAMKISTFQIDDQEKIVVEVFYKMILNIFRVDNI